MLLNVKVCECEFAIRTLEASEYGNNFDTIAQGKLCASAPMFSFVSEL